MNMLEKELERIARRSRLAEASHLQEIEDNPLTAEEQAMFEMFEREGWSDAQCLAYIARKVKALREPDIAAE